MAKTYSEMIEQGRATLAAARAKEKAEAEAVAQPSCGRSRMPNGSRLNAAIKKIAARSVTGYVPFWISLRTG